MAHVTISYGAEGGSDYLVAKGTTRDFNALMPPDEIDRELERDPETNEPNTAEFRLISKSM